MPGGKADVRVERGGQENTGRTLTRGAAEAAVTACYLSDPEIDPLERVRRLINHNVSALREDLGMLSRLDADAHQQCHHAAQRS